MTRTVDLTSSKVMWNSVISTPYTRYICADVKNFYLRTPMESDEYMRMTINLISDEIIESYDLWSKVKGEYVYMDVSKA